MAGRQGFEPRLHGPEPRVLPLNDLPIHKPQWQSDLIIGDGHARRGGSSVHPEFLTLGDLIQCLARLPSYF